MTSGLLHRLSAFTTDPNGGNPAGVWVGDTLPEPNVMQRIAAEVGFSETAFVAPAIGSDRTVRYYSPEAEVSFCGHATIATGVVLGENGGDGTYQLAKLNYDFETLKTLMLRDGLTTLQLVWRGSADLFHSRNPFPVGGVVEDPATGAAAAALGGYLRAAELITVPTTILIRQGEAMGRPSRIVVDIPISGGIVVTGQAIRI